MSSDCNCVSQKGAARFIGLKLAWAAASDCAIRVERVASGNTGRQLPGGRLDGAFVLRIRSTRSIRDPIHRMTGTAIALPSAL